MCLYRIPRYLVVEFQTDNVPAHSQLNAFQCCKFLLCHESKLVERVELNYITAVNRHIKKTLLYGMYFDGVAHV